MEDNEKEYTFVATVVEVVRKEFTRKGKDLQDAVNKLADEYGDDFIEVETFK